MNTHTFRLLPLIVSAIAGQVLLFATPAFAASPPTATLYLTPPTATVTSGNPLAVDITLNTGGQGAGGIDIHLTVPSGLTYSSYDASTSVFTSEVTPPTVSGTDLHLARLLTSAGGYTGTNGEVAHLVFTASGSASTAKLAFDQANSSVAAYTDSSNILNTVSNASYSIVPPVASTPAPVSTPVATITSTPVLVAKAKTLPVSGVSPLSESALALASIGLGLLALIYIRKEFSRK